jgi:hypothetical protein
MKEVLKPIKQPECRIISKVYLRMKPVFTDNTLDHDILILPQHFTSFTTKLNSTSKYTQIQSMDTDCVIRIRVWARTNAVLAHKVLPIYIVSIQRVLDLCIQ